MSEEKKGFTVADRRRFTAEGELKEPTLARETPSPEPPAAPQRPASAPPKPDASAPRTRLDAEGATSAGPGVDFASFLMSLGAQASLLLGLGPQGAPTQPPDLEGARSMIAILEMLRDKTEGRRTPEEEELLEGLLYDLRMAYLAQARVGGA